MWLPRFALRRLRPSTAADAPHADEPVVRPAPLPSPPGQRRASRACWPRPLSAAMRRRANKVNRPMRSACFTGSFLGNLGPGLRYLPGIHTRNSGHPLETREHCVGCERDRDIADDGRKASVPQRRGESRAVCRRRFVRCRVAHRGAVAARRRVGCRRCGIGRRCRILRIRLRRIGAAAGCERARSGHQDRSAKAGPGDE